MPTKSIAMEQFFPQAVAEQWPVSKLAKAADVDHETAGRFLRKRAKLAQQHSDQVVWKLSTRATAIFTDSAMRQLRRLVRLNSLDDDAWSDSDYRIERTAIALLKPLMEWCKLRMDASPDDPAGDPPQLSDGL